MSKVIEIFPKAPLIGPFTQSIYQAVDLGRARRATLQVWVDNAATVTVQVEEADINEEGEYSTGSNPVITLSNSGSGSASGPATTIEQLYLKRRFVRLAIFPSGAANIRAELCLQAD